MRRISVFALLLFVVITGYAAVNHAATVTPIDSVITVSMPAVLADGTVVLWAAPAVPHVALAVAVSVMHADILTGKMDPLGVSIDSKAPVTDPGGSARAGEPVNTLEINTDSIKLSGLGNYFPAMGVRPYTFTHNPPVTDIVM